MAALFKAGRLAEVEATIARWRSAVADEPRALLASAELAARRGDRAAAIEQFARLADDAPDPARVWLRVASLHEALGQLENAIRSCRRAIAARPGRVDARIQLGDLLRIVGRLDEAAEVLEPLVKDTTPSLGVRHALAAVRNGQGRFDEVVQLIEPSLADPRLPANAREHYAVALDELGRRVDAAKVWITLLEADPFIVQGYYRLGRIYRRLRRPKTARTLLAKYEQLSAYQEKLETARKSDLSGRSGVASIERADAYASTNQLGRAVDHYRRGMQAPGIDVNARIAAVLWFLRVDLLPEAHEMIELLRAESSVPRHVADAMTGLLAEREGRNEEAVVAFERALREEPSYPPVVQALARLRGERAAPATRVREELAEIRARLRSETPEERSLSYLRLATLAAQRNDVARQRRYLEAAIYSDPSHAEPHRQLAATYSDGEDIFLQLHALQSLVKLRPEDQTVRQQLADARRTVGLQFVTEE